MVERTHSISRLLPLAALLGSALVVTAVAPARAVPSDGFVISEVYGGGGNSGAPYNADFVELFNRSAVTQSLGGLSIQYTSASGTGNFGSSSNLLVVLPAVDVPPGGSFLVGMTAGTTGAPLPPADAAGTIAMAAAAGKVALVTGTDPLGCNGGSTPCSAAQTDRLVDLIGYGSANFFEGSPAPALSNTTSAQRAGSGCNDTDVNGTDFAAAAPAPQTSASPAQPCNGGGPALPIATCPATLVTDSGVAASAEVSATDADSAIASITLTSAPVDGITLTPTGPGTATLAVAGAIAVGVHPVTIEFATDDDPPQVTSCTVQVTVDPAPALTPISAIQGPEPVSPMVGDDVAVEAVVTSTFTRQDVPDGFFVQTPAGVPDDGDAQTSEGVFVFCRGACRPVAVGDLVRVRGEVTEFFGMTQIEATTRTDGRIGILSSGNPLPDQATVTLPASGSTRAETTFETVEGMVVTFCDPLAVSEYFELARYGQLVLTADERPFQFTHDHAPSVPGYAAFLADLNSRRIILDDDNNDQNDAVSHLADEAYPYPTPGLSLTNRVRGGDTIEGLTGVLHWSFAGQTGTDAWRVRPIQGRPYTFQPANPPTAAPHDVGGDLRIASFNVLNYFTTIDTTSSNDVGPCGPSGGLDCRGADSDAELARQRDKIVAAMAAIDADILGLIELQNDAKASVEDLVKALNAATPAEPYTFVDTGFIGTDAIKVAFVYRPSSVKPIGAHQILDSSVDPDFIDDKNRPALIQTFEENATGERFTAAINHFKSKGSDCEDVGDSDLLDGQGNCAVTRTKAARALADYLATDPTGSGDPDVIVMGDLNSYREEDPITTLEAAGYTDLIAQFAGPDAYSFVFDGQLGYLDHALATGSMAGQVTGATEWHVNADEPPLFDYNDAVRDPGEATFERESDVLPIYAADPRRSSDHDPVVVGLDLSSLAVDHAVIVGRRTGGGTLAMSADVDGNFTTCPTLSLQVEGLPVVSAPTTRLGQSSTCLSITSKGLISFDLQSGAVAAVLALPATFRLTDDTVTFALAVNGIAHVVDRQGRRIGSIWITT